MIEKNLQVKNKLGLHARPAALFVQTTNKFKSKIRVIKDDQEVNGKSIMGVMMLAANKGSSIQLETSGEDEIEAMTALIALVEDCFGESE